LLEVEKLKNKPLSESSVYGRATAIWGILYSKEAIVFQLKILKPKATTGVGFGDW
jgi:hypothetical protein